VRRRNLCENRSSKLEGALRAAAMRRKLISRLINYRSAGRRARGDASVVKRRLPGDQGRRFFESRAAAVHTHEREANTNANFLARLTSLEDPMGSPARRRHFAEMSFEKIRVRRRRERRRASGGRGKKAKCGQRKKERKREKELERTRSPLASISP